MIAENNFQNTSEILDLSRQDNNDKMLDEELILIINEFVENGCLENSDNIEKLLDTINSKLQYEESISMLLHSMRASQSRCLLRIAQAPVIDTISDERIDKTDNRAAPIKEEFVLTMAMARTLLDHQFVSRQKLIHTQMEKALYEIPAKRQNYKVDNIFIPSLTTDFLTVVGLSEVVDSLKNHNCLNNDNKLLEKCSTEFLGCSQCGTNIAPTWKKQKTSENTEEILCQGCNDGRYHSQLQKEFENQIIRTKYQFEEQERSLVRDYKDMLSSPHKLELFRHEQEKKQRIASSKTYRPVIHVTRPQGQKQALIGQHDTVSNISPNRPHKQSIVGSQIISHEIQNQRSETDRSENNSSYLQMLQALAFQASNPQASMDQDKVRKMQQLMLLLQSNPSLATNNGGVLQLLSSVCGTSMIAEASTVVAGSSGNNNNLVAIVNYLATGPQQGSK